MWTMTKTKFEAMDFSTGRHPCGPILSMKELIEDPSLRGHAPWSRSIIRARQYFSIGNPIKMSIVRPR